MESEKSIFESNLTFHHKSQKNQVTVEEASRFLGVTPRSVINYINAKEIEAIKVGKTWFVDKVSLDIFSQRYGLLIRKTTEASVQIEIQKAQQIPKMTESHSDTSDGSERNRRKVYPVYQLKVYQLAKVILKDLDDVDFQSMNIKYSSEIKNRVFALKFEAIQLLGAGFYAFDRKTKIILYNQSREKIGQLMALVYFIFDSAENIPEQFLEIEEILLPAYSSLIKKIENKNDKND